MIKGTVTTQGKYSDKKDICELYISASSSNKLPHEYGRRKPIDLRIGNVIYEAGVHETRNGVVWISSVLYKKPQREKIRLVDALAQINLKRGDRVEIELTENGVYLLRKCSTVCS